jgi:hypothetical protein
MLLTALSYILNDTIAYRGKFVQTIGGLHLETYFVLAVFAMIEISLLFFNSVEGHNDQIMFTYLNIKTSLIVFEVYADQYWFTQIFTPDRRENNIVISTFFKSRVAKTSFFSVYMFGKFLHQLAVSQLVTYKYSSFVGKVVEVICQIVMLLDMWKVFERCWPEEPY